MKNDCRGDLVNVTIEIYTDPPPEIRIRVHQQNRERRYRYDLNYSKYINPVLQKRFSAFVFRG